MDLDDWLTLREPHERLRWARLRWQTKKGAATTMKAAADSLGMKENTYSAYERDPGSSKHTPLNDQAAIKFGKKFKVNWSWLITGAGSPFEMSPAQQRINSILALWDDDEQQVIVDMVEAMQRRKAG